MEIDRTKVNAGRIYDYFLGGNHNFEVDRAAAKQISAMVPSAQSAARLNRWYMHAAVEQLVAAGLDCYLDLATGLPTQGYIHDLAPDAHILYNDIDPVTVEYGRLIVGDMPNVRYLQSNIDQIDDILKEADIHFRGERRIAVCFVGAAYFFDDTTIGHILDRLHNWCAPGSQVALSWTVYEDMTDHPVLEMYRRMGSAVYPRSLETIRHLLARWTINEPGLLPLSEWNKVEEWRTAGGIDPEGWDMYGVIVTRP